jgi:hypothetical protein
MDFTFGIDTLVNDVRYPIEIKGDGTVSAQGIALIDSYLNNFIGYTPSVCFRAMTDHRWMTEEGSYTKRLSKLGYKLHAYKFPPDVLNKIGTHAQNHMQKDETFYVEVTRNLNLAPGDFGNEQSCWWTNYKKARCQLKTIGGLALRTFRDMETRDCNGRAWLIPLTANVPEATCTDISKCPHCSYPVTKGCTGCLVSMEPDWIRCRICHRSHYVTARWCPACIRSIGVPRVTEQSYYTATHDSHSQEGWLAFNGYMNIVFPQSIRLIEHLTGMKKTTKIDVAMKDMYINNGTGYLATPDKPLTTNVVLAQNWTHPALPVQGEQAA